MVTRVEESIYFPTDPYHEELGPTYLTMHF